MIQTLNHNHTLSFHDPEAIFFNSTEFHSTEKQIKRKFSNLERRRVTRQALQSQISSLGQRTTVIDGRHSDRACNQSHGSNCASSRSRNDQNTENKKYNTEQNISQVKAAPLLA